MKTLPYLHGADGAHVVFGLCLLGSLVWAAYELQRVRPEPIAPFAFALVAVTVGLAVRRAYRAVCGFFADLFVAMFPESPEAAERINRKPHAWEKTGEDERRHWSE